MVKQVGRRSCDAPLTALGLQINIKPRRRAAAFITADEAAARPGSTGSVLPEVFHAVFSEAAAPVETSLSAAAHGFCAFQGFEGSLKHLTEDRAALTFLTALLSCDVTVMQDMSLKYARSLETLQYLICFCIFNPREGSVCSCLPFMLFCVPEPPPPPFFPSFVGLSRRRLLSTRIITSITALWT